MRASPADLLQGLRRRAMGSRLHEHVAQGRGLHGACSDGDSGQVGGELAQEPVLAAAADRQGAGDRLAELVREDGFRISTGFAGTPFVTGALSSTGHLDEAYRPLLERECPSWLYPVTMGATTVWERWDSMLPDGTINPGEMTSFNHYALGAVADWMHQTIGDIAPLAPGYSRVLVAPRPGGGLTWARAALETPHGTIATDWSLTDGVLGLGFDVPEGVEAAVRLPGAGDVEVGAGRHRFTAQPAPT